MDDRINSKKKNR